jgi:hypothetical protein
VHVCVRLGVFVYVRAAAGCVGQDTLPVTGIQSNTLRSMYSAPRLSWDCSYITLFEWVWAELSLPRVCWPNKWVLGCIVAYLCSTKVVWGNGSRLHKHVLLPSASQATCAAELRSLMGDKQLLQDVKLRFTSNVFAARHWLHRS